jgi:glucose dehydrogenase
VDAARLLAANEPANAGQWMSYGRDYAEQRFSPLKSINTETVGQLGLAWFADFDTRRGQESTPIVVDGVIYVTTAWSKIYAYEARRRGTARSTSGRSTGGSSRSMRPAASPSGMSTRSRAASRTRSRARRVS